jgi:hypothetical protein
VKIDGKRSDLVIQLETDKKSTKSTLQN